MICIISLSATLSIKHNLGNINFKFEESWFLYCFLSNDPYVIDCQLKDVNI